MEFCRALNPHSGSFCISSAQLEHLRLCYIYRATETAATGVVMHKFPVLKPSWSCRQFLTLEHGNPSFLNFLNQWPVRTET